EEEREKKKHKKERATSVEKEESNRDAMAVCSVKKEDLPPEPPNQHAFLMRRSKTPEDRKKEKENGRKASGDKHHVGILRTYLSLKYLT
ncbi:hypothetical protein ANCDUO_21500, partial [Ancylostoma duodenale]